MVSAKIEKTKIWATRSEVDFFEFFKWLKKNNISRNKFVNDLIKNSKYYKNFMQYKRLNDKQPKLSFE